MLTKLQDWIIKKVFEGKLLGWLSGTKRDVGNILLLITVALTGVMETVQSAALVWPEWTWTASVVGFLGLVIRLIGDMHARAKDRAGQ